MCFCRRTGCLSSFAGTEAENARDGRAAACTAPAAYEVTGSWRLPRTGLPAAGSPGPWPVPIWSLGHGGCGDSVVRGASAVPRALASRGGAAQPPLLRSPTCSCRVGLWRSGGSGLPGSPCTAGDDPGRCAARITPDSRQWGWGKQPAPIGSAPPHVLLDFGGKGQEGGRWAQKEPQGEHSLLLLETCDSAQL